MTSILGWLPTPGNVPRKRSATDSTVDTEAGSEVDSMCPVVPIHRPKRRRTVMDTSISMNRKTDTVDRADSSQAVADEDDNADEYSGSSFEDDDDEDTPYPLELTGEESLRQGDKQSQRKVMFELVFGPEPPSSVVDARLEELIRQSLQNARAGACSVPNQARADISTSTRDDHHPSIPLNRRYPLQKKSSSIGSAMALDEPWDDMDVED